jgi:hypothetical protein
MTVAEKIRQCTDNQMAKLLKELWEAMIAVEMETNHDITEKELVDLLQKPFSSRTVENWLEDLDAQS